MSASKVCVDLPYVHIPCQLSPLAKAVRLSVLGVGLSLASGVSQAASVVVTSNTDNGAMCTLREAIDAVNAGAEGAGCINASADPFGTNDTIMFSSPGTILLNGSELSTITNDVVINASNVSGVTIDANQNSRIFNIASSQTVTLDDLTITGSSTTYNGGGIYAGDTTDLTIVDSTITANTSGDFGGGVFIGPYSKLTATDTTFSSNVSGEDGGAIYAAYSSSSTVTNASNITLTGSTVTGNTAGGDEGGGIWSYGYGHVVELTDTTVSGNTAYQQGGGIYVGGYDSTLSIRGGSVTNNVAYDEGGGIFVVSNYSSSQLRLVNTVISGNSASRGGGIGSYSYYNGTAVSGSNAANSRAASNRRSTTRSGGSGRSLANGRFADGRSVSRSGASNGLVIPSDPDWQLTNVQITNNSASGSGGGIDVQLETLEITRGQVSTNTSGDYGGGIYASQSTVTLSEVTVAGNSSYGDGGGIYSTYDTTITLINSTVSGNLAGNDSNHEGGGIWSSGGYLNLNNSTVSGNSAYYSGGGIWSGDGAVTTLTNTTVSDNTIGAGDGGGVYSGGSTTLINTIIANSSGDYDCSGGITANMTSIIEDGSCGGVALSGDPELLPLADNGGRTMTHALSPTSIAVDAGDNATCLNTDQRGLFRDDGSCDVGAYELNGGDGSFIVIPLPNGKVAVVPL